MDYALAGERTSKVDYIARAAICLSSFFAVISILVCMILSIHGLLPRKYEITTNLAQTHVIRAFLTDDINPSSDQDKGQYFRGKIGELFTVQRLKIVFSYLPENQDENKTAYHGKHRNKCLDHGDERH